MGGFIVPNANLLFAATEEPLYLDVTNGNLV